MRDFFRHAYHFNCWANTTLLAALEEVAEPPRKAVAAYQHVLETEQTWFARIMGDATPNVALWDTPDLVRCHHWTNDLLARIEFFFTRVTESGLRQRFTYINSRGTSFTDRADFILNHILVHSAQYRGEASGFAIAAGIPVPDLDMIFWQRNGCPDPLADESHPEPVFEWKPIGR